MAPGVLGNDTDAEGNPLTAALVATTTQGTLTLNANGSFSYTPNANYSGRTASPTGPTMALPTRMWRRSLSRSRQSTTTRRYPTLPTRSTNEDTATSAIAFTVGDNETAAGSLTVTGSSSNTTLVPNANIVFGGSGANRTVTVTPASNQSGTTTITVTVTDADSGSSNDTFVLTVTAVNDNPTISDIANQSTNEDTATSAIAFTIGDSETAAAALTVSGSSSNTTLVPNANIVFGGSGANRTVTITPASNQFGTTTITVTVTDADSGTAVDSFRVDRQRR